MFEKLYSAIYGLTHRFFEGIGTIVEKAGAPEVAPWFTGVVEWVNYILRG